MSRPSAFSMSSYEPSLRAAWPGRTGGGRDDQLVVVALCPSGLVLPSLGLLHPIRHVITFKRHVEAHFLSTKALSAQPSCHLEIVFSTPDMPPYINSGRFNNV